MKTSHGTKGYKQICLTKNNIKKTHKIHRLVAQAFIPNSNNYPSVNHKDENKENNHVSNLEWCTFGYNTKYGTRTARTSKPIIQLGLNGEYIAEYYSMNEAKRITGINNSHISRCAKKRKHYNTAGGYKWRFKNEKSKNNYHNG